MEVDLFKDVLVPIVGGLGLFMLGLELMFDGIQKLAVNRMRDLLAKVAGTPFKGVVADTLITGVIQSSTAMTVMVVKSVARGRTAAALDFFRWSLKSGARTASQLGYVSLTGALITQIERYWASAFQAGA